MGLFDTLFGRQKPVPAGPERIFAMSTAQITLETAQSLTPTGAAGICFRGMASGPFHDLERELGQLLQLTSRDDALAVRPYEDELGYRWFIFTSTDFQALVTTIHMVSQTLAERGYDSQLLFALFAFKSDTGAPMYWVYSYKRSTFYPFVPQVSGHDAGRRRDNAEEMRLATALRGELPIEPEMERWFAVWNPPL